MIYLDSAATSLLKPKSVEYAMLDALRSMASPGRGGHAPAMRAAETLYECRCAAARLFKVDDTEKVVFTFNATHALNMAIQSLVIPGDSVLVSGFEHNSVSRALRAAGAEILTAGRKLFDKEDTLSSFIKHIDKAKLVVCTHVSNVFGYILPIYEIAALCRSKNKPFIIDASQSAGILDVDASDLRADFIAMPGHKGLMGPQGTGILICNRVPRAFMHGGSGSDSISQHMPDFLPDAGEAGTHNVCGIAGLKAGIEYVTEKGTDSILKHEQRLKNLASSILREDDSMEVFSAADAVQSGVLSVISQNLDCESLAQRLAEKSICVRAGLHCAPLAHESAATIKSGTVRLSFSPFIRDEEVIKAAAQIKKLCAAEA